MSSFLDGRVKDKIFHLACQRAYILFFALFVDMYLHPYVYMVQMIKNHQHKLFAFHLSGGGGVPLVTLHLPILNVEPILRCFPQYIFFPPL